MVKVCVLTEPEHRPCPLEKPRVGLALIFRPCLCVMAKRLRDVCTCRKANRSGAPDAPQFHRSRRGDEALINLEFKIPNSEFEMGEPKSSCKSLEQAEYQEKGPRGPQAGNQTGNRS